MAEQTSVDDLLRRWQSLKGGTEPLTVEELSAEIEKAPTVVAEKLRAVASMLAFLGIDPEPRSTGEASAEDIALSGSFSTILSNHVASDTATAAPPPSVKIPGYEIEGVLGRGGMGVVYRARQVRLNRPCALKMILAGSHARADTAARFLVEAEAIARLQHPNIVQIRHIGEADGLPFFELEYLSGGSLDQQLDGTPWDPRRAARLAEQLARGIAEAHRFGVVHRDLKPANVLLAADGTPKISDFGLAKTIGSDADLTRSEAIMGSPSYMAPEQAAGKAKAVGPAADIYGLGAILYELLTGRPPFRGATLWETLEQVKADEPVPPSRLVPKLPRDLETICLECLHKEPSRRYLSADALAEELGRFLEHRPVLARPAPAWERAARWARRRPAHAALVAVVLIATASLLGGAFWYNGRLSAALGEAEAGRRGADLERKRAEANFAKARAAVDEMLTQVGQEELADIPKMEPVRERLLAKALAFYKDFLRDNANDSTIRKEVARAYGRIGEIQQLLHHLPEAESAYREAIALSSGGSARDANIEELTDLADYQGELGSVLMQAGRSSEAAGALESSIGSFERILTIVPQSPDHEHALAKVLFTHGRLLIRLNQIDRARQSYARSVALGEKLVERYPEVAEYRFDLGKGLSSLGLLAVGPRAWDHVFQKSIGLLRALAQQAPKIARYRHHLGRALNNWGLFLVTRDQARERAVPCYREVVSIYERLAADFPDRAEYKHLLSMGYNAIGELLASAGDPAAERSLRASLDVKKELATAHPDVPDYVSAHATGLATLGNYLADHGRLAEGRSLIEAAIEQDQAALAKVPSDPLYRGDLLQSCEHLARILDRLRDHAGLAAIAAKLSPCPASFASHDRRAAGLLARCVMLAREDATFPPERRASLAIRYGDAAMVALSEAIRKGDKDFRNSASDPELAPLKGRDDFVRLVMDAAFPVDPIAR